jgi:hypothetical protein|tara:strand:- start:50 stop:292 length:243 start_codon:yes stop_codon:yes gene_type:complete
LEKKNGDIKKNSCRRCIIIRYFILAAALIIGCIPLADERFDALQALTVWHFVYFILGIGVAGFILKYIFEMPERQNRDGQ